jgi:hypothetical protein
MTHRQRLQGGAPVTVVETLEYAAGQGLLRPLYLKLLANGVVSAPRGLFAFSTVTSEHQVDEVVEKLQDALCWLRPAVEKGAPALVA